MMKTKRLFSILLSLFMLFGVIGATGISAYAAQSPKSVSLSATSYTYDGKVKKPKVVAKDSKGKAIATKYYTVKYPSGRKNVGTYTVSVKFKGKFKGTKKLSFKIVPKGTSVSSVSAGVKSFVVKYKKQSTQTTGYQIQYAENSSFKSATTKTVNKNTATSYKVNAKGNQKYYVRVRTYKKVGKKNYYSSWSKASSFTTKSALKFQSSKYTVYNGQMIKFTFNGVTKATWSSSSKNVATVDNRGMVVALGKGTCTITIKTSDDKASVTVVVPDTYYENGRITDAGAHFGVRVLEYNNDNGTVIRIYDLNDIKKKSSNWESSYVSALTKKGFVYDSDIVDDTNNITYHKYVDSSGYAVMFGVLDNEDGSYLVVAYQNINGKNLTA